MRYAGRNLDVILEGPVGDSENLALEQSTVEDDCAPRLPQVREQGHGSG